MRFGVLGPLQVLDDDGAPVPVTAPRLRVLLAALLVCADQEVSVSELAELIWPLAMPVSPRDAVQTYVRRLRGLLGRGRIETGPTGYRIRLAPDEFDAALFRDAVARARTTTDLAERSAVLDRGLRFWRTEPLEEFADRPLVRDAVARLSDERLAALELSIGAQLELGGHHALIPELQALTRAHPTHEGLWGQLMLALHRSGRQSEAFTAYDELAAHLAEQLGVDPGLTIRQLRQSLLTDSAPHPPSTAPTDWTVQQQLPLGVGDFVGRAELLARGSAALLPAAGKVPVVAITGPPGAGKTATAIRLAHSLVDAYPDGQWYVELGRGPASRDRVGVLEELLRASGADPRALAGDEHDLAKLLRTRIAGRRVLLVLDDARTDEQVRAVLPGTPGAGVLVTSRRQLLGLVATAGAMPLSVPALPDDEAIGLLVQILGKHRVESEREQCLRLVRLCGGLPLALRIAAANLLFQSHVEIGAYCDELAGPDRVARLAVTGDPETAVRPVFDLAYDVLDADARRCFRLIALSPAHDLTTASAAALLGCPEPKAAQLLATLAMSNLLQVVAPGRFALHDLLRLYAAQLVAPDPEASDAWRRLVGWYVGTTRAAVQPAYRPLIDPPEPDAGYRIPEAGVAREWLDAEFRNLLAVATDPRSGRAAADLAEALRHYMFVQLHFAEWEQLCRAGIGAARDARTEGLLWQSLATRLHVLNDSIGSIEMGRRALELFQASGFVIGEAAMLANLGLAHNTLGELDVAAELLCLSVARFRDCGADTLCANALLNLSHNQILLGDAAAALASTNECLALEPDDPVALIARINRGTALRMLGDLDGARSDLIAGLQAEHRRNRASCFAELALTELAAGNLCTALSHANSGIALTDGTPLTEAETRVALGWVQLAQGNLPSAQATFTATLTLSTTKNLTLYTAESHLGLAHCLRESNPPLSTQSATTALHLATKTHHAALAARCEHFLEAPRRRVPAKTS
ncbi:AfsR/SARP family transcriptional regulator [Kribbella karoonensis]|uniref:BTAD domain-containing putative transcriptional regulator n=1 Tax=Kribbella karoonensis TaxID=324851 RepID=A0ABN2CTP5_9ACTN|nr:BTAD domain-containing putative transcriptional regulator [Kribbella sp.]